MRNIYQNHLEGLKKQLDRKPGSLPEVEIPNKSLFDLKFEDFTLKNYDHQGFIKFPVAV